MKGFEETRSLFVYYEVELYRQQGFAEYADKGDSVLMVREV